MPPVRVKGLRNDSIMTNPTTNEQIEQHGRRRDTMKDYLSEYIHVENLETLCRIGLTLHLEGDLKHQTGTVRDLVKGTKDNWCLRDIHMGDNDMWQVEVIIVE